MYQPSPHTRGPLRQDLVLWLAMGALFLGLAVPATAQVSVQGWDTQTARVVTYAIDVDMYVDEADPSTYLEHDTRNLIITIGSGQASLVRTSSIENSTESFGPYAFAADGSLSLLPDDPNNPNDQKWPPLEAVLLMRVFSGLPVDPQGQTWSYLDPELSNLTQDHIELQQKSTFQHLATNYVGSAVQFDFDVEADIKLFDNLLLSLIAGYPGQRSPEMDAFINGLIQDGNLFLFGTVTWEKNANSAYGQTDSADLMYVAAPHSGGTRTSIASSTVRQHLIATLVP